MTVPETDAMLEQFAELAELGVGAEAYAFARGMPLAELERACQARWGIAAQAVAERMRREPARLLTRILQASSTDNRLLARLLDLLDRRADRETVATIASDPRLSTMTREQLLTEAERSIAHERALLSAKLTG